MSSNFILGLVFLCLATSGAIFKKTYFEIPLNEIKKRKALGDNSLKQLDKALSYGEPLRTLLWIYFGLTTATSLTLLATSLPIWLSIIVVAVIIYWLFSMLPSIRVSAWDRRLTKLANPSFIWVLRYMSSYLKKLSLPVSKHYKKPISVVFDQEDLVRLIKSQSSQPGNRVEAGTLLELQRTLSFSKYRIKDVMTPAKRVKTITEDDIIGPILINDIHESGQDYALVKTTAKGSLSGSLALKDLNIKSEGKVSDFMNLNIYYLNQDSGLREAVKAFFDTKQTMFVVINDAKKFVGILNVETVVKELTGSLDSIKFEGYNNPDVVANLFNDDSEVIQAED